jgi:hypothetical protein
VNIARLPGRSDTPGAGSTLIHNPRAAHAILSECDVGVLVVSADPPMTAVEAEYLVQIRRCPPQASLRPEQG